MKRYALAGVLGSTLIVALAAGCTGRSLTRDDEIRLLTAQNRDLQERLRAAEQRTADLLASGARPTPAPRPAEDPFRPVAVRFGPFTGGLDTDGRPGAERLKVVLQPVDAEGDVVKRAGSLDLEALEPAPPGQPPRPYHRWTFSREDLAQTWLDSLGTRGYVMKFDWPSGRPPAGVSLILRAWFTTLEGEVLTTETAVPVPGPGAPPPPSP